MTTQTMPLTMPRFSTLLACVWLCSLAITLAAPASWDVAWRLEIADRILTGELLYRDIIELNPPLWFWSALPSAFLAKVTGIAPFVVLSFVNHGLVAGALWLIDQCLKPIANQIERHWLLFGALAALLLIPVFELGQREQPVLLATLLWGILAVRRSQNIATSPILIATITALSAYGFALKHYYLIVPIGIELWLIFQLKRAWRPFRFETVLLASLGGAYAVAALKFAPNFLPDIVPLIQMSYDEVRSVNVADPWLHPLSMALEAALLLVPGYFLRTTIQKQPLAQIILLGVALHVCVIFIQGKGFGNHFLAAKGCAFVLWTLAAAQVEQSKAAYVLPPKGAMGLMLTLWFIIPTVLTFASQGQIAKAVQAPQNTPSTVAQAITTAPKSARIYVASTNAGLSFFYLWNEQRPHFSRYYAMWMLPGLLTSQLMPDRREAATHQLDIVRANTIEDIVRVKPQIIIGDTTSHGREGNNGFYAYDIKPMAVLLEDAQFRDWLSKNYTKSDENLGVTIWSAR